MKVQLFAILAVAAMFILGSCGKEIVQPDHGIYDNRVESTLKQTERSSFEIQPDWVPSPVSGKRSVDPYDDCPAGMIPDGNGGCVGTF